MISTASRWAGVALATAALLCTSGCGGDDSAGAGDRLEVLAGFYPLQWTAERVGGDRVAVQALTPAGGEPHDLELTPRDVASIEDTDLLVYLAAFQPAIDDAAAAVGGDHVWNAATGMDLLSGKGNEVADPHFWLDPVRLADVGDALADRLTELDPDGASTFAANAAALRTELETLDGEMRAGLGSCAVDTLVTAHDAFGYLADRYGFDVVGINGLSPSREPAPAQLAVISRLVAERGVTTVYTEALVDPSVAETVAAEAGVRTAVLDPVEGLTDESAGSDYLEVMRSNLATLRDGQSC